MLIDYNVGYVLLLLVIYVLGFFIYEMLCMYRLDLLLLFSKNDLINLLNVI